MNRIQNWIVFFPQNADLVEFKERLGEKHLHLQVFFYWQLSALWGYASPSGKHFWNNFASWRHQSVVVRKKN
ncbi:MAG: hypothetical protein IKR11_13135 [Solobacterium sp.]|nr:hypothetical protein [Solobacterium sp.]